MLTIIFPIEFTTNKGGVAQSTASIVNGLSKMGLYKLIVVCPRNSDTARMKFPAGVEVITSQATNWSISKRSFFSSIKVAFDLYKKLKQYINNETFFVTNHSGASYIVSLLPVRRLNEVYVNRGGDFKSNGLGDKLMRFKIKHHRIKYVIATSTYQRDILVGIGMTPNRISVIHNGLPLPEKAYEYRPLNSKCLWISTMGFVSDLKSQHIGVELLKLLRDKGVNAYLNLYGDVTLDHVYKVKLDHLISDLGLKDYVFYRGFVRGEELFEQTDILISFSKREGFGRSLVEGMFRKIPVIAYRGAGGPVDITDDGKYCHLVDVNDSNHYFNVIIDMLNNPEATRNNVLESFDYASKMFSEDVMAKKYSDFFAEIIETKESECRSENLSVLYISNYFNHHQKPFADALYARIGCNFSFIETTSIPEFRRKLGYKEMTAQYVLRYNEETRTRIDRMILDADVVIYGEAPLSIIKARYRTGKLTFRNDESRFKNPNRYLKWPIYTYNSFWLNKGYLLCASAYAPIDYFLSGMKPRKCFRWGYFTELKEYNADELMNLKRSEKLHSVSILWVGRLIKWKHPDSTIRVAEHLKKQGLTFNLNIIGRGKLEDELKKIVAKKRLDDVIHFLGSMSPLEVRKQMEKSDIFLFTSDRQEGWGAVLNESMNSGCAVVADGNIGSVPYLIDNGVNGMVYKSTNWTDLCDKVEWLIRHPKEMSDLGRRAYQTIHDLWNAEVAANNFLVLSENLINGLESPILIGPCSSSPILMRKWKGNYKTL